MAVIKRVSLVDQVYGKVKGENRSVENTVWK